jgi:hypothetical protein
VGWGGGRIFLFFSKKKTLVISDLALIAADGLHSHNMGSSPCFTGVGSNAIQHVSPKKKKSSSSSSSLDVVSYHASINSGSSANCLDKHLLLGSQDVRQFLFKVWAPPPHMLEPNGEVDIITFS